MFKIHLVDVATDQLLAVYAFDTDPTFIFRLSKTVRMQYGCDENDITCINNTDVGSDVLVSGKQVARINVINVQ